MLVAPRERNQNVPEQLMSPLSCHSSRGAWEQSHSTGASQWPFPWVSARVSLGAWPCPSQPGGRGCASERPAFPPPRCLLPRPGMSQPRRWHIPGLHATPRHAQPVSLAPGRSGRLSGVLGPMMPPKDARALIPGPAKMSPGRPS